MTKNTKKTVFSKFQQKGIKKIIHRSTLIDKIPSMSDDSLDGLVVTFHGYDKSLRHMKCNLGFFNKHKSNKRMTSGEIVMKINTYTHDYGAKYFTIQ